MKPEGKSFQRFIGARAGASDFTARSIREAFADERACAVECFTPRPDPERRMVAPALALVVVGLVALGFKGWL